MAWEDLLERNRRWAADKTSEDAGYFERQAAEHKPKALFVGCCDARAPVNLFTDTQVGDLFIHRNIANQVTSADASLSAGIEYAIDALGVQDVIVCGHHACGGVRAALSLEEGHELHLHRVEAWIEPLRLLARVHRHELDGLDEDARVDQLVELNVEQQVRTLSRHPSVRQAWASGRTLRIHGWVYQLRTGLLQPRVYADGPEDLGPVLAPSSAVAARAK